MGDVYVDPNPTPPPPQARSRGYVGPERRHQRRNDTAWTSLGKGMIGLAIGVVVGTISVLGYAESLAQKASKPVIEERIRPVEQKLDKHLAEVEVARRQMLEYVQEERSFRRAALRKLDALCRGNPRSGCPLGVDDE